LYNIGFLIYMIRFRYKLNKKIAELGTSMGGKNNAATDKMRKKLNMIAIFLIAVSCSTLTIIMVAVFFLREADETFYWTIQTIGRVVGVGLGVVLLRAFWPRNAIKHAKTTIRGNIRVEPAGSTKVLGTPATPSRGGGLQPASKSVANRAASPDPAQRSDIAVSLRSGSPVQRPKETVLQIPAA
jgi:hypothetical protein